MLVAAWFACLIASGLSAEVVELPHPIGALVSGLAGLPFLFVAAAFVHKSVTVGTTFNVVGWLLVRSGLGGVAARLGDDRWLSLEDRPRSFWSNVLLVGAVAGGLGALGVWALWFVLVDVMTRVQR